MSSNPRWTCGSGADADRTKNSAADPRRASRAAQAARPRDRATVVFATVAAPIAVAALSFFSSGIGLARDTTGLSDSLTQEQRDWVRGLRAASGASCCDDADGIDPVWDIADGQYRVRYGSQWLKVSSDALLTQPNRIGVARAWLAHGDGEVFVRCFLPGPTT